MSKDQGRRLQMAREHAGYVSGRNAALRLGWKYPTYAAHESGIRSYPPSVAQKYARAFNVHPDFLTYGTRPPEWWSEQSDNLVEVSVPVRYMSLFSTHDTEEIDRQTGPGAVVRRDYCIADQGDIPAHVFAYRVVSDELPDLPAGSVLIMEKSPEKVPPGSIVLLSVRRQTNPSLRKSRAASGGRTKFVATNENYDDLEDNEAKVIGRAILHVRPV